VDEDLCCCGGFVVLHPKIAVEITSRGGGAKTPTEPFGCLTFQWFSLSLLVLNGQHA